MKGKKKKRINDKGFTLVELLIAIAIVAIIVSPMLDGIVTSMNVNKKSDALQKETAVANTVMESMENMSLDDIAVKFSQNHSDISDLFPAGFCDNSARMGEIDTTTKCITETDTGTKKTVTKADGSTEEVSVYNYGFKKNSTGKYVFALNDVRYDNEKYDVRITLDSSNANYESFNDALYVDLDEYDKSVDGMFAQDDKLDKEICGTIATDAAAMGMAYSADDIDDKASRTITVKIYTDKETISGVEHTYTKADVYYRREVDQSIVGTGVLNYREKENKGFYSNKADETKSVRNLYIMFKPNYNSKDYLKDKIVIENLENIPVNVYLIKQNSGVSNMYDAELAYKMEVRSIYNAQDGVNPTAIRTNLGYNLERSLNNKEELVKGQCRLILENIYTNIVTSPSSDDFYKKTDKITGGSNEYVRMFDKKVEIFSKNAIKTNASGCYFDGASIITINSTIEGTP